jgi:hypothetical protein
LLSGILDIEYCLRLAQAVPAELLRYSMAVFFDCASVDFCYQLVEVFGGHDLPVSVAGGGRRDHTHFICTRHDNADQLARQRNCPALRERGLIVEVDDNGNEFWDVIGRPAATQAFFNHSHVSFFIPPPLRS